MPTNFDYCGTLVREADRDRYLATLFAPAEHRDALFALYAFNVEIARVRDLAREPMPGEIRLQWWREALAGERASEAAANPVAAALSETLARYKIDPARLEELIDAHTFDLYDDPIATVADLENYGARTQSVIFATAAGILSNSDSAEALSAEAGIAFAMASVLSGLGRHAARRQLYVPLDVLERHQIGREDIFARQESPKLKAVFGEMCELARRHLAAARGQFTSVAPAVLPALLPVALVGPSLRRMERRDYRPFEPKPLSLPRRQWLLWRAARNPKRIFRA
jgi:15-cis-phytoene synthase